MPTATTDLTHSLTEAIREIRGQLAEANIGAMRLDIEVIGRTHGELKIEFVLGGESCYSPDNVRGGDLDAVVTELIRRKGWSTRYAPLCLPRNAPSPELNDEILFLRES